MGCNQSAATTPESRSIDEYLRLDWSIRSKFIKLLLLGPGDSGKSTFAKQMKLLFLEGFAEAERAHFGNILRANLMDSVQLLLRQGKLWGVDFGEHEELVGKYLAEGTLVITDDNASEFGRDFKVLFALPWFAKCMERAAEYNLPDNFSYLMDRVGDICSAGYMPSTDDVIWMRIVTTSVSETCFEYEDAAFRVVDVGGQRSERRKWFHCFSNVTAILFVSSLHEYDMKLSEDASVNRMHESMQLFDEVVNCDWFKAIPVIFFMNKADLLRKKLGAGVTPSVLFSDYKGGTDFDKCIAFIQKKFLSLSRRPINNPVHVYVTTATNTENVRVIFATCKEIFLKEVLTEAF